MVTILCSLKPHSDRLFSVVFYQHQPLCVSQLVLYPISVHVCSRFVHLRSQNSVLRIFLYPDLRTERVWVTVSALGPAPWAGWADRSGWWTSPHCLRSRGPQTSGWPCPLRCVPAQQWCSSYLGESGRAGGDGPHETRLLPRRTRIRIGHKGGAPEPPPPNPCPWCWKHPDEPPPPFEWRGSGRTRCMRIRHCTRRQACCSRRPLAVGSEVPRCHTSGRTSGRGSCRAGRTGHDKSSPGGSPH